MVAAVTWTVLATTHPLAAPPEARGSWGGEVAIEQAYTDNVRSEPEAEQDDEYFSKFVGFVEHRQPHARVLPARVGMMVRGHLFYRFPNFDYVELRPQALYSLGRTDLMVLYGFIPRRLLFDREEDGGAGVYFTEHLAAGEAQHKFGRHKRLRARLLFELEVRDFSAPNSERSSVAPRMAADVRYQVVSWWVPRVGFELGTRNARSDNYSRDEAGVIAGFDAQLGHGISGRFRYRRSWRDYTVDSERDDTGNDNSNFRRNDDIDDYRTWLTVAVPPVSGLAVRVRYFFRNGDSSRADRIFARHEVGIEAQYVFAGISEP